MRRTEKQFTLFVTILFFLVYFRIWQVRLDRGGGKENTRAAENSRIIQIKRRHEVKRNASLLPKIFFFGVTHSSAFDLAYGADATWAKRVMGDKFVWFTDKEDPLKKLRNVIVLLPPEKETKYSRIYWRTLDIWKYVLQHYEGYDWYVRAWEDNYLVYERYLEIAPRYNCNDLIEIGRVHNIHGTDRTFMDGGSAGLISKGVFLEWRKIIHLFPRTFEFKLALSWEDVTIHDEKKQRLNITYVDMPHVFNSCAVPFAKKREKCFVNYTEKELTCRSVLKCSNVNNSLTHTCEARFQDVPASFHYISNHSIIDRLLYDTDCA